MNFNQFGPYLGEFRIRSVFYLGILWFGLGSTQYLMWEFGASFVFVVCSLVVIPRQKEGFNDMALNLLFGALVGFWIALHLLYADSAAMVLAIRSLMVLSALFFIGLFVFASLGWNRSFRQELAKDLARSVK